MRAVTELSALNTTGYDCSNPTDGNVAVDASGCLLRLPVALQGSSPGPVALGQSSYENLQGLAGTELGAGWQ